MATRDSGDFIDDFAYPLPVAVICEMLGIPDDNHEILRSRLGLRCWPGLELSASEEELAKAAVGAQTLYDYLHALVTERADNLGDDLLSLLLRHQQEDQLTREEVVWAAHHPAAGRTRDTPPCLLGNGLLALIRNPDQLERLARAPDQARNAVEEFLRYDPSLLRAVPTGRRGRHPGRREHSGGVDPHSVTGGCEPGIRESSMRQTPSTSRRVNADQHLAFAAGRHLCAGHAVARLEGQIAFERIVQRLTGFELDGRTRTPGRIDVQRLSSASDPIPKPTRMTRKPTREPAAAREGNTPRVAGRVMARLTQAIDWFDNSLQNVVASSGFEPLHRTQSMIMMHIALGVSRPSDIAREMGLTRQNVHHMAKSLIDAGIIDSAPDPDDPRRTLYQLSEKSSDMRNLALDTMRELEAVLEQRIGARSLNGLRAALEADWGPEVASADELPGRN